MSTIRCNVSELRPGELLTGTLTLQFTNAITLSHITLSLTGSSFSRYVSGEWTSVAKNTLVGLQFGLAIPRFIINPAEIRVGDVMVPTTYQEHHSVINKTWKVFGQSKESGGSAGLYIEAGKAVQIPFVVKIPLVSDCSTGDNHAKGVLPPSFERTTRFHRTKDAKIDYTLGVALHKLRSTGPPITREWKVNMNSSTPSDDVIGCPDLKCLSSKIDLSKKYKKKNAKVLHLPKKLKLHLELVILMPSTLSKTQETHPRVFIFSKEPTPLSKNKLLVESFSDEGEDCSDELTLVLYNPDYRDDYLKVVDLDANELHSVKTFEDLSVDGNTHLRLSSYRELDPSLSPLGPGDLSPPVDSGTSPDTTESSGGSGDSVLDDDTLPSSLMSLTPEKQEEDSLSLIYLKGYAFNISSTTKIRTEVKSNAWGSEPISVFKSTKPQVIDLSKLKPVEEFKQLWMDEYEYPYAMDISDCFSPLTVGAVDLTPSFETCNVSHYHDLSISLNIGATPTNKHMRASFSKSQRVIIVD